MATNSSYLKKRIEAFSFAFKGIYSFFAGEAHAKIHLVAAVLAVIAGTFFQITVNEWIAVIILIALVLAAEAFNSAIELLTDSIYKEQHAVAGKIKDMAAGAVLFCAIAAAIVGCIIFIPYILEFCSKYN